MSDDGRRLKVLVDPGHGGPDTGAVSPCGRVKEADLVYKIGRDLHADLNFLPWCQAFLSRDNATDPSLMKRGSLSTALGVDLVLSIHADSGLDGVVQRGSSLFWYRGSVAKHGALALHRALPDALSVGADAYPADNRWPGVMNNLVAHKPPVIFLECCYLNQPVEVDAILDPWVQRQLRVACISAIAHHGAKVGLSA